MPYYSFVLLCYNNWDLSQQAITTLVESLSSSHLNKGIELIIVNNGSSDETKEGIEQIERHYSHEIKVIPVHLQENMGYPVGVNMGLAQCRGKLVTVLNNDLVFPENWFDGIVKTLESNSSIGVAVPFLSYGSGHEHLGVSFQSLEEMRKFAIQFMEDNKDELIYSERVIGACLSFKRELLHLIGGNDFWFGLGLYDDDDWSLRAGIAGYKSVITGSSFVHHIGTVTFHQQSDSLSSAFHSNYPKFARKWNRTGWDHTNRKDIIKHTNYSKQEHYFPLKFEDFNKVTVSDKHDQKFKNRDLIMVADWMNESSQWKSKLLNLKQQLTEDILYLLWVPQDYFPKTEVVQEIEKILDNNNTGIHYLFNEVSPIDLLKFFSRFDAFLPIENDYVNLYLKYLVEKTGLEII
ncbi:glycosyltransferase family 2 protein [Virgibacillus sp. JSM 102003]|uniref:glycosyltransferase family 2 protein n=1 Tax=Virgibacillus sp. JSM 102003 TaxID=1562108 RepID=UPI0035C02C8E